MKDAKGLPLQRKYLKNTDYWLEWKRKLSGIDYLFDSVP